MVKTTAVVVSDSRCVRITDPLQIALWSGLLSGVGEVEHGLYPRLSIPHQTNGELHAHQFEPVDQPLVHERFFLGSGSVLQQKGDLFEYPVEVND